MGCNQPCERDDKRIGHHQVPLRMNKEIAKYKEIRLEKKQKWRVSVKDGNKEEKVEYRINDKERKGTGEKIEGGVD